jgi:hypothetical protein
MKFKKFSTDEGSYSVTGSMEKLKTPLGILSESLDEKLTQIRCDRNLSPEVSVNHLSSILITK